MNFKWKKPDMVHEAAKTGGKNVFIELLMFIAVYYVAQFAVMIPFFIGMIVIMVCDKDFLAASISGDSYKIMLATEKIMNSDSLMIVNLFATVMMIIVTMLFCKLIQKRKMRTLGFKKPGMWKEYGLGLLIGFGMMATMVLICALTGAVKLQFNENLLSVAGIGMLLLIFIGFLIQGMSEEVLCRSYFLVSVARRKNNIWLGIILNAVAFGLLHLGNPGITPLSMVNLILFGIFASVYFVKRGSIWGVAAIHSIWNFAQGNIFGILVSGQGFKTTIFTSELNESLTILNGGSFGMEGGILTTIITLAGIVIMLFTKQKDFVEEEATIETTPVEEAAFVETNVSAKQ